MERLTKEMIYKFIQEELNEVKAKKDKPTCSSRKDGKGMNRFHDEEGKFSTKKDAKSSSVRNPKTKDCKYAGQGKENPHRFTRVRCGRKEADNPNRKADYVCKSGEKVVSEDEQSTWLLDEPTIPKELQQLGKGMMEQMIDKPQQEKRSDWRIKYQNFIRSLTRDEQREVKQAVCSYDPITMAKIINQFARALDGKLDEPIK